MAIARPKNADNTVQEQDIEGESMFSVATAQCKRARSATVQGDDDEGAAFDDFSSSPPKRRRFCGASPLHAPAPSSSTGNAGKARLDLSPATEAAIREMPDEIKKAIKTMKMVRKYVKGLLEFKSILDHRQMELDEKLQDIERREALD